MGCSLSGQSIFSKQISIDDTSRAEFHLPWVHQLEVMGSDAATEIELTYGRFGEYQAASTITFNKSNDILIAHEKPNPNFEFIGDKLSAHKLYATTAKLIVPSGLNLHIMVGHCQVNIKGDLDHIHLQLKSGFCSFEAMTLKSSIESIEANICVSNELINVNAFSKHGLVSTHYDAGYESHLDIGTSWGDVFH
ncbi:MAG: hypothetical protein OXC92_07830 [Flavobacteriaceae bacterium]|nr:hypothetical protein [Flavobacteriaceae bacterium]MCY4216872.1 hypothetical protein [Flavobacteriaceae bacterium]MCY4253165.1 hypothetical protein [Flavobacteriaceae bacterium]